jgi:hypothetical protein
MAGTEMSMNTLQQHECGCQVTERQPIFPSETIQSVSLRTPTDAPYRRVVSRARFRPTGKYPSWRMGRMVQWESHNEKLAFKLLDADPEVVSFSEQRCEIIFSQNSELKTHYPDIYVVRDSAKELLEVKSQSEASDPEIAQRTALLAATLPRYGYSYRLWLDTDLKKQPALANADLLLRHGRLPVTDCDFERTRLLVQVNGSLNWSDACNGSYGLRMREIICRLTLEGVLNFDRTSPISATTNFFWTKQEF